MILFTSLQFQFDRAITVSFQGLGARIQATYNTLLNSSPDHCTREWLLVVATKESWAWLSAPPISSVGLCMEDDVIRVTVWLCLGVQLCEPHQCCHCRAVVG